MYNKAVRQMEKELKELQGQGVPQISLLSTDVNYISEYNVCAFYKTGNTECANSTYFNLNDAVKKAMEWYKSDKDMVKFVEISLQISELDENEEEPYLEIINDTVVMYIKD